MYKLFILLYDNNTKYIINFILQSRKLFRVFKFTKVKFQKISLLPLVYRCFSNKSLD